MIKIVSTLYHAVNKHESDVFVPLETDNLAYFIDDPNGGGETIEKSAILTWIFKKAFEDLIISLLESLVKTNEFFELMELGQVKRNFSSQAELREHLDAIKVRARKMHFPKLIDYIEEKIGKPLHLKDEILSI